MLLTRALRYWFELTTVLLARYRTCNYTIRTLNPTPPYSRAPATPPPGTPAADAVSHRDWLGLLARYRTQVNGERQSDERVSSSYLLLQSNPHLPHSQPGHWHLTARLLQVQPSISTPVEACKSGESFVSVDVIWSTVRRRARSVSSRLVSACALQAACVRTVRATLAGCCSVDVGSGRPHVAAWRLPGAVCPC